MDKPALRAVARSVRAYRDSSEIRNCAKRALRSLGMNCCDFAKGKSAQLISAAACLGNSWRSCYRVRRDYPPRRNGTGKPSSRHCVACLPHFGAIAAEARDNCYDTAEVIACRCGRRGRNNGNSTAPLYHGRPLEATTAQGRDPDRMDRFYRGVQKLPTPEEYAAMERADAARYAQ